ncbi:MAG: bifunctional oligoribonuclease/PAP phosphatase NrnA [Syntrophobacteraceae bacterium]|jgi:nanoRNase/pAp phosphatase (c-di-AMP/oligoRNAs hydrolase)|nr:bifunctional oligoribonuclease/PAP phosphatase NrnA [Syntrophobacteraceae bacterium]
MHNDEDQTGLAIAKVLDDHRGEAHVIVLQDFPDPDAISSAVAHQLISAAYDIKCDIVYSGKISHQQNMALVKLLGIELLRYDRSLDFRKYAGSIFVDNQGTTAEEIVRELERIGTPPLLVVDHHEPQQRLAPLAADIRRNLGATATIYAEYLELGLVHMEKTKREHVMVATALTHGILTDTMGLIRACPEDFHAAGFLSRFRDADLLEQIMNQARSKQTMEVIHRALGNRVTVESFSVAGIGYLRTEDRDAIPQAADFLVTEENVHTAIVYGIVAGPDREEALVGSMRTLKLTLDPDDFIKEVLGKDTSGGFYGGGKMSAGGFQIPMGFLSGGESEEFRKRKWEVFDAQIKQRIFAKIGVRGQQSGANLSS